MLCNINCLQKQKNGFIKNASRVVLKFSKQIKEYRKTAKLRKMNKYDIRELHFETLVLIGTVIVETKKKTRTSFKSPLHFFQSRQEHSGSKEPQGKR